MKKTIKLTRRTLADKDTDRTVREAQDAIHEVASHPLLAGKVIASMPGASVATERLTLTQGEITKIRHGLGYQYNEFHVVSLIPSVTGTAGHIEEVLVDAAGIPVDPAKEIWLRMVGYGPVGTTAQVKVRVT